MNAFVYSCALLYVLLSDMYQCICSDTVQYTYPDKGTELGEWKNDMQVGQHVYTKKGRLVCFLSVCSRFRWLREGDTGV